MSFALALLYTSKTTVESIFIIGMANNRTKTYIQDYVCFVNLSFLSKRQHARKIKLTAHVLNHDYSAA